MRLWSLHPRHLDRAGLIACWREALLAQAVLAGRTRGYTRHPQLERFRATPDPLGAVGAYLVGLAHEAGRRGYRFDSSRIDRPGPRPKSRLPVTSGQVALEREHLASKLAVRAPEQVGSLPEHPGVHPIFTIVDGPVEPWERNRP